MRKLSADDNNKNIARDRAARVNVATHAYALRVRAEIANSKRGKAMGFAASCRIAASHR